MPKLALRDQTVDIADIPLRQDVLAKNALMPAQRDFGLGNSPLSGKYKGQGPTSFFQGAT
jgi:hypothetical protein